LWIVRKAGFSVWIRMKKGGMRGKKKKGKHTRVCWRCSFGKEEREGVVVDLRVVSVPPPLA